jgi:nicotinate-nucleotide--dimethylbenzimidazole phosphoribosyltransferase
MNLPEIPDIDDAGLAARLQAELDRKTKPLGALGALEALALRIGLILGTDQPCLAQPQLVVFAGDHGLAARGVSAYPSDVTWQMVRNFLAGGAAVSVLARQHGIALTVVDCGVRHDFEPHPNLVSHKVAPGTADALEQPAMSAAQCDAAIANGRATVAQLPGNALLVGEMGIGNTSSAALLLARLGGHAIGDCVGAGTGLDEEGQARKRTILAQVLERHAGAREPLHALAAFGGFEVATMVGAVLQAAHERRVIVVDGFIAGAAVLVASRLAPKVLQRCVFAHRSAERGHRLMLGHLGVRAGEPAHALLDLELRLGEGSGAALAWPLLVSACNILRAMATFDSAQVSGKTR